MVNNILFFLIGMLVSMFITIIFMDSRFILLDHYENVIEQGQQRCLDVNSKVEKLRASIANSVLTDEAVICKNGIKRSI